MSLEIDFRNTAALRNVTLTGPEQTQFAFGLEAPEGFFIQRATEHVRNISAPVGLRAAQPPDFAADHQFQQTTSGAVAVHLYQLYKNIPVFQGAQSVVFAPDGSLQQTSGNTVPIAGDLEVSPKLKPEEAALIAARFIATPAPGEDKHLDQFRQSFAPTPLDLKDFDPKPISSFPDVPERPTVLDRGPFGEFVKASLIWFPLATQLRLCWEVVITLARNEGQFRVMVSSDTGEILYATQLMQFIAAQGNVFRANGGEARKMTTFPLPLAEYGLPIPPDLPPGFPDDWAIGPDTSGNSVRALLDPAGTTFSGSLQDSSVVFDPANPDGDDQKTLNLFFYTCYMHDFFYLLGFREQDGNFQVDDLDRGGIPLDRVDAHASPGVVFATANMTTPPDGHTPTMNMGLVSDTGRHTAFDATVVFHEFMHGVTNRLVGGPQNNHALEAPQSKAMGEGWGDFIACTLNDTIVVAAWVVNDPAGIRAFRYDSNFPDHFGKLGKGRYSEPHNVGEIWCAVLMEMTRGIGKALALQIVVDALKLSPATPSFLDMRDSILLALDHRLATNQLTSSDHDSAMAGIWTAFAKFGMGVNAKSNGASYSGNLADFTAPASSLGPGTGASAAIHLQAAPSRTIPDKDPVGVSSSLTVGGAPVTVASIKLSISVTHPFVGDLQVTLIAPDGAKFLLESPSSDSSQNLIKTYTEALPALAGVVGKQANGDWTLNVADLVRLGVGVFQQWSLDLSTDAQAIEASANV